MKPARPPNRGLHLPAMSSSPDEAHLEPYREAVRQFGPGFRATLWGSREAQSLRFDVMIKMVDFTGGTIVDAGCGDGGFAAHLIERGIEFDRFVGIDAMPEMIEKAASRQLDRCEFLTGNFAADLDLLKRLSPDWITISGSLNTMRESEAKPVLERCFDTAAQGIVFNFLSDRHHPRWASQELGPAQRYDTVRVIDWALGLTHRVAFRQDYLDGHDATVAMLH